MMDSIKAGLFSIAGFAVTLIHVLIITGALCTWIFIRTQVLGASTKGPWPTYTEDKK